MVLRKGQSIQQMEGEKLLVQEIDLNRVQNRLLEIKFNNFHNILGFKTCFAANLHQSSRIKIANYFRDLSYFYFYPHIWHLFWIKEKQYVTKVKKCLLSPVLKKN